MATGHNSTNTNKCWRWICDTVSVIISPPHLYGWNFTNFLFSSKKSLLSSKWQKKKFRYEITITSSRKICKCTPHFFQLVEIFFIVNLHSKHRRMLSYFIYCENIVSNTKKRENENAPSFHERGRRINHSYQYGIWFT